MHDITPLSPWPSKRGQRRYHQNEKVIEELRELRRLQERTFVDKARGAVEDMGEADRATVGSVKESISRDLGL